MKSVNPKYLILLFAVIAFAVYWKLTNPYLVYSSEEYWASATIESVQEVPEEALEVGNKHGSVLMFAASFSNDPEIVTALVERGADINEVEARFLGTPLTGAAAYSKNPAVIHELVRLGAKTDVRVSFDNTALMTAAMLNKNPGIIEALMSHGASLKDVNSAGQTALDIARSSNNNVAIVALKKYNPDT